MKTLLFLPKGFIMVESGAFIDIIGWARNDFGYDVQVVTCGFQKQVTSTFKGYMKDIFQKTKAKSRLELKDILEGY